MTPLRLPAPNQALPLLGGLSVAQFLRDYWHKKPLLVRAALPDWQPKLSYAKITDLAANSDIESRLIRPPQGKLKYASDTLDYRTLELSHGPLPTLPTPNEKGWTVLVQGIEAYDPASADLLSRFRFLPAARLDDVMVSYASDQGGVGPHFDSYDVFLVQGAGARRWDISAQQDLALVPNRPLKLLRDFRSEQSWTLHAGDLLYLPPHYAHHGVAVGNDCMTYSIGFRAPTYQELGENFLHFLAQEWQWEGRYGDPDLTPSQTPACLTPQMLAQLWQQLTAQAPASPDDFCIFLGEYFSASKAHDSFDEPLANLKWAQFQALLATKKNISLAVKSRMLYSDTFLFLNGESFQLPQATQQFWQALANQRQVTTSACLALPTPQQKSLHRWLQNGWLVCT